MRKKSGERELLNYIEQLRDSYCKCKRRLDLKYSSSDDFYLKNGKFYKEFTWVDKKDKGPIRECYNNAARAVLLKNLIYVEGYALDYVYGNPLFFPHAWCIDREGKGYELTWKESGSVYFGVCFSKYYLMDFLRAKIELYPLASRRTLLTGEDVEWRRDEEEY